jgi:AraC-type DNA-binding domain-containing proteins
MPAPALAPHRSAHSRMVSLLSELVHGEGILPSPLPSVKFMRATRHVPPSSVAYDPCIIIIAQGRKQGRLGERTFVYDPDNYLVLTLPLPFECETHGAPDRPLLGFAVRVTPALVAELLLQSDAPPPEPDARPQAVESAALDPAMSDAAVRLLECLRSPADARILGSQVVREITYRALLGPLGANLRALVAPHNHMSRISRVLDRLHAEFTRSFDVETLAREAGMSVSAFHAHFKAVTSASPLQYLKTIRLHKARMLMVNDGTSAAEAAGLVGYQSASQFSREFKRLFGDAPATAAAHLRATLTRFA